MQWTIAMQPAYRIVVHIYRGRPRSSAMFMSLHDVEKRMFPMYALIAIELRCTTSERDSL